jgi:hypothetical protein
MVSEVLSDVNILGSSSFQIASVSTTIYSDAGLKVLLKGMGIKGVNSAEGASKVCRADDQYAAKGELAGADPEGTMVTHSLG